MIFAIPEEPSAPKDEYGKVNRDAGKSRHRGDPGRNETPKRTDCPGCDFTGPTGIADSPAGIQAAVLSEKQGHGNARKDPADNGERMVAAALGAGFHDG